MVTCGQSYALTRLRVPVGLKHWLSSQVRPLSSANDVIKEDDQIVRNAAGIQMIHRNVWKQLFPHAKHGDVPQAMDAKTQERVKEHLSEFGLWGRDNVARRSTPEIKLPKLQGNTIAEHLHHAATDHIGDYHAAAKRFSQQTLPPKPAYFVRKRGWTRYARDGTISSVGSPEEDAIVFDVETLVQDGHFPTLAAAVSKDAWYTWCCDRLANYNVASEAKFAAYRGTKGRLVGSVPGTECLIPLEQSGPEDFKRVVIGHNVSYDRARVLEQYNLRQGSTRFIDTMSLHMATSGLSSQQLMTWHKRTKYFKEQTEDFLRGSTSTSDETSESMNWVTQSSPPSLKLCAKLWCDADVSKEARNIFVNGTMTDVHDNFQELMLYCVEDVDTTHRVFKKVFYHYSDMYPSMVTFAGMLEINQSYLPTDRRWGKFIQRCQSAYDDITEVYDEIGVHLADKAAVLVTNGDWQEDPWLRHLDWSFNYSQLTVTRLKKDGTYTKNGRPRPSTAHDKPDNYLPAWYRKVFPRIWDATSELDLNIRLSKRTLEHNNRLMPYLLNVSWKGEPDWQGPGPEPEYPLFCHPTHKWGYLVPMEQAVDHEGNGPYLWKSKDGYYHTTHEYFKLPSDEGEKGVCGNIFSKEYIRYVEEGRLSSPYDFFIGFYDIVEKAGYWVSSRSRLLSQFIVWEKSFKSISQQTMQKLPPTETQQPADCPVGVIIPMVVPMGTVTRRSVERTWLTASNPSHKQIASEVKSRIRAPPGHKFVGADVDSQELWIAAIMGDSEMAKSHGSTALGWMTLQGEKSEGTDMHSHTASVIGITRDQAKILNYARIYGAAQSFAARLLMQFDATVPAAKARSKAEELYNKTKGKATRVADQKFPQWDGGSESYTFNRLEAIARTDTPTTPILHSQISSGLQPRYFGKKIDQFLRSRVNWVVQSSAVDYLHILITSMNDLCTRYDIQARYSISIHDEIRYIVADEDVDRAAYALHLSNMITRAAFSEQLGINDLPEGVAFFSAVDIDHILRKEVYLDCITPSHQIPEPPGESVDIFTIGDRVGWDLTKKSTTSTTA
eukprot:m.236119 g.236119  ORF g.236119 m.236119 type:complete len:1061 (-) comp33675_c1_seq1:74-3256(-)